MMARRHARLHPAVAALATLLAFVAPAAARAQVAIDALVGGGYASPLADLKEFSRSGPAAQVAVGGAIPFTPFALRAEVLYVHLAADGSAFASTPVGALGFDLLYKIDVPAVRPYVVLGPAFYRGYFARQFLHDGNPALLRGGFNIGAGLQAGHGRARGFVEGRYHALRIEDSQSDIRRMRFVLVTAGVQVEVRKGRVGRTF